MRRTFKVRSDRTQPEEGVIDNWQAAFLSLKQLPPEFTAFEIEALFYVYAGRTPDH